MLERIIVKMTLPVLTRLKKYIIFSSVLISTHVYGAAINMAYVETNTSSMGGNLSVATAADMAASKFNMFILSFLNICSRKDISTNNCTVPSSTSDAILLWNNQPTDPDDQSNPASAVQVSEIKAVIGILNAANKKVLFSVGGWINGGTWSYFQNDATNNIAKSLLGKFDSTYSPDGYDLDFENSPYTNGFIAAGHVIAGFTPAKTLTIAPVSGGITGSFSNQYCSLYSNKVTANYINIQFYAGGYISKTDDIIKSLRAGTKSIKNCDSNFTESKLLVGLGPNSPQLNANNNNLPNCDVSPSSSPYTSDIYSGCKSIATSVASHISSIGGFYVWDYDILFQPLTWASDMASALSSSSP
ncbi:glycosyl hydrolase family 18 protein [Nitrospirillum sp. BR 11752]|uniref:glycosyl hydrolase family 18 protein n=1 Tax=Nitrospirillum sp. BR 11752 TaxID=3104293 RepID=UPI002E9B60E0|nr:glycosyl hydrolase family 18 protein [Nitrospirillum sp. BR 11752]